MVNNIIQRVKSFSSMQAVILIGLLPVGFILWQMQNTFIVPLICLPIILGGYIYRDKLSINWKTVYVIAMLVMITVTGLSIFRTMRQNVVTPPEFDFKSFWLNGRLAVQGMNFYDPENYRTEAIPLNPTIYFTHELLDSAFWYPPPSILMFLPLGWFTSVNAALLAWYIFTGIMLALSCWVTWKQFFYEDGLFGLLFATALIFLNHAVWSTVFYGQSSIFLLLIWLLIWKDRDTPRAGLWLGISILIKPFMIVLFMYFVLQKQWRTIIAAITTLLVACVVVLLLYGVDIYTSYQPTGRLPPILYVEWVNQSLLSYILRITQYDYGQHSPIFHPLFLILGGGIGLVTAWLTFRANKQNKHLGLAMALLLALICYPSSLMHYSILLVIPFALIWKYGDGFVGGIKGNLIFITIMYVFITYDLGSISFFAYISCWVALAVIAYRNSPMIAPKAALQTANPSLLA